MEVFTAEGALFFALVRVKETSAVKTSAVASPIVKLSVFAKLRALFLAQATEQEAELSAWLTTAPS